MKYATWKLSTHGIFKKAASYGVIQGVQAIACRHVCLRSAVQKSNRLDTLQQKGIERLAVRSRALVRGEYAGSVGESAIVSTEARKKRGHPSALAAWSYVEPRKGTRLLCRKSAATPMSRG